MEGEPDYYPQSQADVEYTLRGAQREGIIAEDLPPPWMTEGFDGISHVHIFPIQLIVLFANQTPLFVLCRIIIRWNVVCDYCDADE